MISINWHERYQMQANWTRPLRDYVFQRCGIQTAEVMLEVGCGTGAVLEELPGGGPRIHGLDISRAALREASLHAQPANLAAGDALALPYRSGAFDITFCHFALLWISNPVQALLEMKRVTASSGYVVAFAEPDYGSRNTRPAELEWLAKLQNEALERQGAALRRGAELAQLFQLAGISLVETGIIRRHSVQSLAETEWQSEWEVLEADLADSVSATDLARVKEIDRRAVALGEHALNVPTHFAWGQV